MTVLPAVENAVQTRILVRLRDAGPSSRVEIGQTLGISRPRVVGELDRLTEMGWIEPTGEATSRGGRPSQLVVLAPSLRFIGVDVGVTSIDVAVFNGNLKTLGHVSADLSVNAGPSAVLARIRVLVKRLRDRGLLPEGPVGIGIGLPGPVTFPDGVPISPPIMPGWDGFEIRTAVSAMFTCPVVIDNDVNAMALGELHAGVSRSVSSFLFVKIGTGIGAAVVIEGRVYRGVTGSAGEIGHICVDENGLLCGCSRQGCLETVFGGRALAREALQAARDGRAPMLAEMLDSKGTLSAEDVGVAARRGDPIAIDLVRDGGQKLGSVLASLVNALNPGMIVIGGGVAGLGHALLAEIRTVVYRRSTPLATLNLPIVASALGGRAGVIGAAYLASGWVFGNNGESADEGVVRETGQVPAEEGARALG